jgi:hypothetical protein
MAEQPSVAMKALIVYEDVIAGEAGREVARDFASANDFDDLEMNAWNAAMLDESYFSDFITEQAAAADMIVIAIREAEGLTQSLKRWIHRWTVREPQKHRALAVWLHDADRRPAARVTEFIKQIARHSLVDFFHQHAEPHATEPTLHRHEVLWVI